MLKHLNIFTTKQLDDILVVTPKGQAGSFLYNDLHREANTVRDAVMKPEISHLVINLSKLQYFGSEFIGSLVSMAREVKNQNGRVALCAADPQMVEVLQNMSLFKLWPYYASEEEALTALKSGDAEPKTTTVRSKA
ncbi:MAG: STAS domain-containing protein [Planctomycetaceae bacterium]|nr:STAS domain-containing protein [Planctomycetaceae bacterium]